MNKKRAGAGSIEQVDDLFPEDQKMHDPGGKVRLALSADVKSSADFGGDNKEYRYTLKRVWDASLGSVLFVMMNPSTADPYVDDPTVAKCQRYARAWGYGTMLVGNTFAYRATNQKDLLQVADPVGPKNDKYLLHMAAEAGMIVLAYGKPHKNLCQRGRDVAALLRRAGHKLHVLKLCNDGTPSHPLYLRGTLKPYLFGEAANILPTEALRVE
ncbi:MAG: DUF1643 domain-containing protein, partial [Terracidiphilus sp.]